MRSFKMALMAGAMFLVGGVAQAATIIPAGLTIDFRVAPWTTGADGLATFTAGGVTASAWTFSGAIPPAPPAAPDTGFTASTLFANDPLDGLGVRPGEPDEINTRELLQISFATPTTLTGVWITDLFTLVDGTGAVGEKGQMFITHSGGTEEIKFVADPGQTQSGPTTNGDLFISFGGPLEISRVAFVTDPFPGGDNNEYSVAGFVAAVPEPASLALMGAGLLGLGLAARRRRKA